MRCQQFESRLNAVLDERRDPAQDPQLGAHARSCPPCRGLLETHRRILLAYRQQKRIIAAPTPAEAWQNHAPAAAPRNRTIALAALLATACAVPLLLSNWPSATRSDQPHARRLVSPQPVPTALPHAGPSSRDLTVPNLVRTTAPPETLNIPWGELRELNLERLLPELELPRQQGSEWLSRVRQVGGSLRPLTNSVTSTISILRRTWPGTHVAEPKETDQVHLPLESNQLV